MKKITLGLIAFVLLVPAVVGAITYDTPLEASIELGTADVEDQVIKVIKWIVGILFYLGIIIFLLGAIIGFYNYIIMVRYKKEHKEFIGMKTETDVKIEKFERRSTIYWKIIIIFIGSIVFLLFVINPFRSELIFYAWVIIVICLLIFFVGRRIIYKKKIKELKQDPQLSKSDKPDDYVVLKNKIAFWNKISAVGFTSFFVAVIVWFMLLFIGVV